MKSKTSALASRLAQEQGQALLLVIIVVAALTISIAGVVDYVTSSQTSASRTHASQRALDIAEAGLNDALSNVSKQDFNNNVPDGTVYNTSSSPTSLDQGKYTYVATKCLTACGANKVWTITATGTGRTGVVHQLQTTLTAQQADAFDFGFFIADANGCTTTKGTSDLQTSVWIAGDFCPNGNSSIVNPDSDPAHKITVYIGGDYNGGNNNTIGASANPVNSVTVVGNCKGHAAICSAADKVWAGAYSKASQTFTKPPIYPDVVYASGNWSTPTCTSGASFQSFVFDTNTTRDTSVNSPDLTPGKSYDCTVTNSSGAQIGRLAYSKSTNTLSISGTVFIDGSLDLPSLKYTGSGSIYVNGTLSGGANTNFCGPPAGDCSAGGWDNTVGSLLIVAVNAGGASTGFSLGGNGWYDIDAYVNSGFTDKGGSVITGSVIADSATITGNGGVSRPGSPPPGAPIEWDLTQGNWQQLK